MNEELKKAAKGWCAAHSNKGCKYDCEGCWQIEHNWGCEQHNMELAYIAGAEWADEHPKQKPVEWSDDDEENLQHSIAAIHAADYYTIEDKNEMEMWLKSIKQRIGWKQ